MGRFWDGESSAMERGEVYADIGVGGIDQWRLLEEEQQREEAEREAQATEILGDPDKLHDLHLETDALAAVERDVSRMFRNVDDALKGRSYAVDACLQAILSLRQRCMDDARRMLEARS